MRVFASLLFVVFCATAALGQRADTIYLYNGDRITGEIIFLRDNKLSFKTDRAGTISVEWPSVHKIYSANYFDVVTNANHRVYGRLLYTKTAGAVSIEVGSFTEEIKLNDIVAIDPIKSGFFEQLTGSINLSASYTKANENLQLNGGFDITHRTLKYQNNLKANTVLTRNKNQSQTERTDASYNLKRLYSSPWFISSSLSFQRNTELNIDARYQVFGGGGYFFILKPGKDFSVNTGFSANVEQSIEEPITVTKNIEYVAGMRFHQFSFRNPQIDILSTITTYTSLNVPGRFRFDMEITFLWELFNNFKWNVTLYNNFDNRPPGGENALNDWNVLTGITYTL